MIRYRLTDGTLVDVDPAYEQIFLASNPGAVLATEEVVEEKIVSPDEISESTRLMENYRLENESDEDLYKRITPTPNVRDIQDFPTQQRVVFDLESGKPIGVEDYTVQSVDGFTIDGISKTKNGKYYNQNNEPATEEEILKFEELTTLNNIRKEALKLKSNLAANYEMSDSELLDEFDEDNFDKKKKEKAEKNIIDDSLNFNFEKYLNYRTKKQQDGFVNFLAKTNAPLTAKHQGDYNTLVETKLPKIQEQVAANYESQIETIKETIIAKYQRQADNATSQEEIDSLNEQLNKEIETALTPINDKIVNDINEVLKNDVDVIKLDEQYQSEYLSLQEKQWQAYSENWKPKSKHFSEEQLNDIGVILDKQGFAFANGVEKKAMLHKFISNLDRQGDLPVGDKQEVVNEFYGHFYNKLEMTPTEEGEAYSPFILKDIASSALKTAEKKLKEETAKYKDKLSAPSIKDGVQTVITARQQAEAANPELLTTIDYAKQVLDAPERASNTLAANFFKGLFSEQGYKYVPVVSGLVDLNKAYNIYKLAEKQKKGTITKQEEQALQLYAIKNASDKQVSELSTSYNIGKGVAQMPAFIGEIILTGPLFSGVKKTATKGIINTIEKGVKKRVASQIDDVMIKGGGRRIAQSADEMIAAAKKTTSYKVKTNVAKVVGFVAGTGAQTAANPQRYLTSTFENMTPEIAFAYTDKADDLIDHLELTALVGSKDDPNLKDGDNFVKAFSKAFGTTWAEYATERMGELLPAFGKSVLAKMGVTKSPEWLKRMTLGLYMRKFGLNKSEAFAHFAKNQAGWNGILGELSEELINIPLSNLINGNDLTEGLDAQGSKELLGTVAVGSLAFGGGNVLYNNMTGKTNPVIFVDNQRQADEKSAMDRLKKLQKEGRLNEETDIEIRNDFIAFDNISKFLEDNGLSNKIIKTGGLDVSKGNKAASETEIMNEIDDPNQRKRLEDIDSQVDQKQQEIDTLNEIATTKKNKKEQQESIDKIDKATREIEALKAEKDNIIEPIKNKIIKRKKTEAYIKGLANLKNIMEKEGIDPDVLQEATSEQQVREILRKTLLLNIYDVALEQRGDRYFDPKTGDEYSLDQSQLKDLEKQINQGVTSHGGFLIDPKTGKRTIIINKDAALKGGGANVAGHEFLHYFLAETLNKHPELKLALGEALSRHVYNIDPRQIRDTDFRARVQTYQQDQGTIPAMEETLNILSDAIANGTYQYSQTAMTKLGDIIRRVLSSFGVVVEFKDGRDVFNFIRDYNRAFEKGELTSGLRKTIAGGAVISGQVKAFAEDYKSRLNEFNEKIGSNFTLEDLDGMGMLFSKDEKKSLSEQAKKAKDILIPYGEDMDNFNPNSDIISKQLPGMIKAQAGKFLVAGLKIDMQELIQDVEANMLIKGDRNFDGRGDLYGYLNQRIKFRILDAFNNNPTVVQDFNQEQLNEAKTKLEKEIAESNNTDVENTLLEDQLTKVNVLQVGKIANKVKEIRKVTKVKKGDTHKQITDNNKGRVGSIIFGIPANKIDNPKENITTSDKIINPETGKPVKQGEAGIPERSEATNIQDYFADINTTKNFIKAFLTDTNVSEKDADINKIGENIQVLRDVYGRAIGLPNRILEYFYDKKFNPNGKRARSQGKTSQVPLWQLKSKFRNLNDKELTQTAKQFQKDLGITEKQQTNKLPTKENRSTIGQLLKGAAVVTSMQASLSTAQRILYGFPALARTGGVKAKKQEIASVTAAQSKLAYSIDANMDIAKAVSKARGVNVTYTSMNKGTISQRKKAVDKYIDGIVEKLVPLFKDYPGLIGNAMLTSENVITDKTLREYARKEIKKRAPLFSKQDREKYGKKKFSNTMYSKKIGKNTMLLDLTDNQIEEINNKNVKNFDLMWEIISNGLQKDPTLIEPLFHFFDVAQNETSHLMRLGAPLTAIDKTVKINEFYFEHALQNQKAAQLLLLSAAIQNKNNFKNTFEALKKNYKLIAISKNDNKKIDKAGYKNVMSLDGKWNIYDNNWWERYFNQAIADLGGINPNNIRVIGGQTTLGDQLNVNMAGQPVPLKTNIRHAKTLNNALVMSRSMGSRSRGITVLDFDDTLATTKSLVKYTTPDGKTGTLNAEEYASTYQDLLDQGYKFDFSDFNKVVKGKLAPLFNKALKLQKKFGPSNMFVLTARPPQAQKAIFDFLKANGLNIPLKNITGLGNSTAEAKALWMADKVANGYNDFYFADDALQNVQAVDNVLSQFDVKRKVQQAKVNFNKSIDADFNKVLEEVTSIDASKRFSDVKARKRGASKGKFRFFIPPSHEDFVGLLYNFMGKGRKGDAHRDFFERALVRPLNRGYRELDTAKQAIANDYKSLNKKFPEVKKRLKKKTLDGDFTFEDAIRIYLWNKHGYDIPGLSLTDQYNLTELVTNDADLKAYADAINIISKQDKYVDPGKGWEGGNIKIDLIDATGKVGRAQYLQEFLENADIIFSEENLNKIEAAYGANFRSALEDMLHRIKTGVNRPKGQSATINKFMNYLNGSVGAVMFFNMRSAILQQMSIVNYINFADNNIFMAAKAFANQPQYWKDWVMIFNSDMLKQRRGGIGTDINGAELAEAVSKSKNPTRAAIGYLLQLGFKPTQIGDNIAIATGGATFYRNRVNKYIKDGMSVKEAEAAAFTDFQNITQSTQQSSRPDMTSQQQSMWIGKMVLNFQNITSQYNRLIKKAASDIYNRRMSPPYTTQFQSDASNMSRILYYGAIQNLIFYSLQSALFAVMFGDEDESNEKFLQKQERVINGTIDSILRGSGIYGVAISTLKNMAIKWHEQRDKKYNKDESAVIMEGLNFSPVVGIKARKLVNAEKTLNYNKKVIDEMETFDIDNPIWSASTNYIEALTNLPVNRLYQKTINLRNALDNDYEAWQRALFFSGYTTWSLGLGDTKKMQVIKETVKTKKKEESKQQAVQKAEEKKKEKEEKQRSIVEENKKKKDGRCAAVSSSGKRCKNKAIKGSFCTIHEETKKLEGGKKVQCRKRKADGTRCKMQTSNKSKYCYYHD